MKTASLKIRLIRLMEADMFRRIFVVSAISLALTFIGPEVRAQTTASICDSVTSNLVQNCGFEVSPSSPISWVANGVGIDSLSPNSGFNDAFLGTGSTLSQILSTNGGISYNLFFYLFDENGPVPTDSFTVTLGGFNAVISGADLSSNVSPAGYSLETFPALPGSDFSGGDTLMFSAVNDISDWNLDDVVVTAATTAVPEPASADILGAALAGLAAIAALRRRLARNGNDILALR